MNNKSEIQDKAFKNYRWENALTKEDMESFIKQSKN